MAFSLRLSALATLVTVTTFVACAPPRTAQAAKPDEPAKPVSAETNVPASAPQVPPRVAVVVASDRMAPVKAEKKRQLSSEIEKMLRTVDAERVFQTAVAKPGVPVLAIQGATERRIQPGQSVAIEAQAAPDAVVTYMVREGGAFENGQASITVQADEQGLAMATLTATAGTVDDVYVQVGSPSTIGTVSAVVHVLYPDSPLVLAPNIQP